MSVLTSDRPLADAQVLESPAAGSDTTIITAHPRTAADAALLEAWQGYTEGFRAFYAACDQMNQEEANRFHAIHTDHHRKVIEHAVPQAAAGYAVQLRFLFAALMECRDSERSALDGEPFSEDLAATLEGDYRPRMLWRMAEAATRAAAEAGHPLFPTDTTPAASSPSHTQPEATR